MNIIDTHSHYNLSPLSESWVDHWQKAQEHGVTHSLIVGTDIETSTLATKQVLNRAGLVVAPGIHPSVYEEPIASEMTDTYQLNLTVEHHIRQLADLIEDSSKVVALGETGLDYFRLPTDPELQELIKKTQAQAFIGHIHLAELHKKPLIIHVRDQEIPEQKVMGNAYWDTLNILRNHHSGKQAFILHCVSGPMAYVKEAASMGAYFGMAGNVTYKKADHLRSLIRSVPPEKLLLETDAPFLPPQDFRGKVCEPWMIRHTAEFIADFGVSVEQVYENSQALFKLQP